MCFSIGGGDARAPPPFDTLGCGGFLERSLMCCVIAGLECAFDSGTDEITWRQEDTIVL